MLLFHHFRSLINRLKCLIIFVLSNSVESKDLLKDIIKGLKITFFFFFKISCKLRVALKESVNFVIFFIDSFTLLVIFSKMLVNNKIS